MAWRRCRSWREARVREDALFEIASNGAVLNDSGRTRDRKGHHRDPQRACHSQVDILRDRRCAGGRDDPSQCRRPGQQCHGPGCERPVSQSA